MFTGIIEGLGTITAVEKRGQSARLAITAPFDLKEVKLGASIAVNGACLTVTDIDKQKFFADISYETLQTSETGGFSVGEKVNLERALLATTRLDGHIVSGHVDGVGKLLARKTISNAIAITIGAPQNLLNQMALKGSVAVDGVSLTINELDNASFGVSIIPHTKGLTTIGFKPINSAVNIETDILAKYVQTFLVTGKEPQNAVNEGLTLDKLAENGFI